MISRPPIRLRPVAHQILGYLLTHGDAQDTVEGIAEWWLLEQQVRHMVSEVKEALAELAAQKLIIARQGSDGRIHYRVDQTMQLAILTQANLASRDENASAAGASEAGETGLGFDTGRILAGSEKPGGSDESARQRPAGGEHGPR